MHVEVKLGAIYETAMNGVFAVVRLLTKPAHGVVRVETLTTSEKAQIPFEMLIRIIQSEEKAKEVLQWEMDALNLEISNLREAFSA